MSNSQPPEEGKPTESQDSEAVKKSPRLQQHWGDLKPKPLPVMTRKTARSHGVRANWVSLGGGAYRKGRDQQID